MVKNVKSLLVGLVLLHSGAGCFSKDNKQPALRGQTGGEAQLLARGKAIYTANCTACHHPTDPRQAGGVGPEIAFSSMELLQAKVIDNRYPEGYEPKRRSALMVPLKHLKAELPALEAFLKSFEGKQSKN